MRAGAVGHLQNIARNWHSAWAGRRDNLLPRYWAASEARRAGRQAWYARQPGLLAVALLLSAGATLITIEAAAGVVRLGQGSVATRAYLTTSLSYAASVTLLAALLLCLFWLLGRLGMVAQLALGFLERQPRQQLRQTLDDMLAVSCLSEQEIITGFVVYGLRRLNPPLIAISLLSALLTFDVLASGNLGFTILGAPTLALALLIVALSAVQFYLGGLLAAVALILMLLPIGLANRVGLMPYIGARSQVVLQVVLLAVGGYLATIFIGLPAEMQDGGPGLPEMLGFAIPAYLLVWLLFYLARRADWLRGALGYGFPLIVASAGLALLGYALLSGDSDIGVFVILSQAWALQGLALISPQHVSSPLLNASFGGLEGAWVMMLLQWLLLLLFQLGYIVIFAEFARDAIRRRKWGTL